VIFPRIIPVLLLEKNKLIQTKKFEYLKYLGDPINALRVFNDKKVDELVFFDIGATVNNLEPNYELLKNISKQSRMPLCYGGGVKNLFQFEKIIKLGFEKVSMSTSAILDPKILKKIVNNFGSQSVIITLDVKIQNDKYFVYIHNGKKRIDIEIPNLIKILQDYGVGEIIFNLIDRDGMKNGYDLNFIKSIKDLLNIPFCILGGANSYQDFELVLKNFGLVGLCAGSMFSLKGKFNSVLLQYLNESDKINLQKVLIEKFNN
jgi:cyclase